jgi:hypothetical protein
MRWRRWGWSAWLEEHVLYQINLMVKPNTQTKFNKKAACFCTRQITALSKILIFN